MYTLIIEDRHGRSAAEISFEQGTYTIGRVDGNDVVLASSSVSRTHARIFVNNNKCFIDDLGSANGVLVDGTAIRERTEIRNGSKIRIGEYTLYLVYKDQNESNGGQEVLKTQIVSGGQSGYKIVRVGDKFAGEEFMLSENVNTIGRAEESYILLSDSSISRNHARIVNMNATYAVTDLDSSNGTFVNNKRIKGNYNLNPGDLVRFGNISFVFVPASQHVDTIAYANVGQRRSDNRALYIAILIIIVLIIAFTALFFFNKKETTHHTQKTVETVQESNSEVRFQARVDEADKLFKNHHYDAALNLVKDLQAEQTDNTALSDLRTKIETEMGYQKQIEDAQTHIQNGEFDDAIKTLKEIPTSSANYDIALKHITDTESKLRLTHYNNARSNCESGLSVETVTELCNATKALHPDNAQERDRIEQTVQYMERISAKKSKHQSAARKCAETLQTTHLKSTP